MYIGAFSLHRRVFLGISEKFCKTGYDLGVHLAVIVSAKYSNNGIPLDRHTLFPALRTVINEHPALCVGLSGQAKSDLRWVRIPTLDLNDIVTFSHEASKSYSDVLSVEMATRLKEGHLWRLTVLRDNTVILSFNHALGDGRSGLAFHRSLLAALNTPAPQTHNIPDESLVSTPTNLILEKPAEALTSISVPILSLIRTLFAKRFSPVSWLPETFAWTGYPVASEVHSHMNVRVQNISGPDVKAILALCRGNNTTLTGFLNTLAYMNISRVVHQLKASGACDQSLTNIGMSVAFDLREITGVSPDCFTLQASAHKITVPLMDSNTTWPPTPTSFPWDAAVAFCRTLPGRREQSKEGMGLLQMLYRRGDPEQFLLGALGKPRDNTVGLSNLGRLAVPALAAGSGWEIGDMAFVAGDATTGPPVAIFAVGSPAGSVHLTYAWGKGAVDTEVADAFVEGMQQGITSILQR